LRKPGSGIWILVLSFLLFGCGYKTSPRPATATVPGDVALVNVFGYPDRVVVQWDIPKSNFDGSRLTDLSGFKVYRNAQVAGEECENCPDKRVLHANVDFQNPSNAVIGPSQVTYTDNQVKQGNVYAYSVSAYNLKGREGPISQEVSIVFEEPPPVPRDLRGEAEADGVSLDWPAFDSSSGAQSFRVYRGSEPDPEKMKSIGSTKLTETHFLDKKVEKGGTYYYMVRSFKMNRGVSLESAGSPVLKVFVSKFDPPSPTNVKVTATRRGLRIDWDPVKTGDLPARYNLYRSEAQRMFVKLNQHPITGTSFLDTKVALGRTYRYTVSAFPEEKPEEESGRSGSESVRYTR
jgi:fibronectin type 3 domain-containing protein